MTTWKIPEACADISESDIRRQDEEVLRLLLVDRTLTSHNGRWTNIKWGTGDYALSHPGVVGFSADDEIQMDLISSADGRDLKVVTPRVRCRAYRGTDKSVWYDQRECEGPIAEQIHDAYAFVCKNMRVGSELVATRRRDVYELPVGSVREAICNAVFHRNYLEPSEVYVALYDDRLEITSPGGLVRDMTIEQAEHGYSKIRNDGLALALSYMKEVEGWGGGVARYFSDWTAAGLPRPKLEETPGFFKVVFDRKKKAKSNEPINEPLNETVKGTVNETVKNIVANLICKTPGIGSAALVSAVGKSRATVMRSVALLKQQGIIEHRGSDKTGGYFPAASAQKEAK